MVSKVNLQAAHKSSVRYKNVFFLQHEWKWISVSCRNQHSAARDWRERRDVESDVKNQTRAEPVMTQFLQSPWPINTSRNSTEVNELLGKEEILAHKREAVIDDAVLPCHRVHRQPQEYAASLGCGSPMTSIHLMMANNAGACDRLDYGLSCKALQSTWLLPSSHEFLICSCALVINL